MKRSMNDNEEVDDEDEEVDDDEEDIDKTVYINSHGISNSPRIFSSEYIHPYIFIS